MYKILNFQEHFCWKRKKISIADKNYTLIAGYNKSDTYNLNPSDAIAMQGFLICDEFIYLIPPHKGVFEVYNLVFLVTQTGVWCAPL